MENVINRTIVNLEINLENKIFQNCFFINCLLIIESDLFRCLNCDFDNCNLNIINKNLLTNQFIKIFIQDFENKKNRNNILKGVIIECGNSIDWKVVRTPLVPPDKDGIFTFTSIRPNTEVIGKIRRLGDINSEINFNTQVNSNSTNPIKLPLYAQLFDYKIISGNCGIFIRVNGYEI